MGKTRTAVLVDFGGVITSSVLRAFTDFGASLGGDPRLPLDLLARDQPSRTLLADHECGRIDAEAFERGFAERLRVQARGVADREVDPMMASRALSGMVSVMAYNAFVLGERQEEGAPVDFEELVSTVTRLWANALRFPGHR
ncbi:hypothetical protein [Streptomyces aurantiogriseus]